MLENTFSTNEGIEPLMTIMITNGQSYLLHIR